MHSEIPDIVLELAKGRTVEIHALAETLLLRGIPITYDPGTNTYDFHLDAKSHMYAKSIDENRMKLFMRYGEEYEVSSLDEICECALKGMHGRDFISLYWAELLEQEGYTID